MIRRHLNFNGLVQVVWFTLSSLSCSQPLLFHCDLRKGIIKMTNEEKESSREEENCVPLTDEEFKAYQEEDARKTKRVLGAFSAIWDAIRLFFD